LLISNATGVPALLSSSGSSSSYLLCMVVGHLHCSIFCSCSFSLLSCCYGSGMCFGTFLSQTFSPGDFFLFISHSHCFCTSNLSISSGISGCKCLISLFLCKFISGGGSSDGSVTFSLGFSSGSISICLSFGSSSL